MNKSDDYRRNAANCLEVAEHAIDPSVRSFLLTMARAWHNLADQADRNSRNDIVYETPPPPEQQQPVVLQQQQTQPKKDEPEC